MIPLLGLIAMLAVSAPVAEAETRSAIFGQWRTEDGNAIIAIAPCGDSACGVVARILDPTAPRQDINNPRHELRGRALIGVTTLSGFAWSHGAWRNGTAYDPKSGRSYSSVLRLQSDGKLGVTGCILFLCQTQRWTRLR